MQVKIDNTLKATISEYIDPNFEPIKLTPDLNEIYDLIYSDYLSGSRKTKEYRVQQLLTLLHTKNYEHLVLSYDPRITYLPFKTLLQSPSAELISLVELDKHNSQLWEDLWLSSKPEEEIYRKICDSPLMIDRICGITLFTAYKIEEIRCEVERCKILGMG